MDVELLLSQYPRIRPFVDGVFTITRERLSPLNGVSERDLRRFDGKSILDPLVGYSHLTSWEAALIETELFQRLRRIRQLGLAYLVYPSLGYGRFEHTIGVLGRAAQILQRLQFVHSVRAFEDVVATSTIEKFAIPLRLAALFHDVGHCVYSHVSERAISELTGQGTYPSVKEICEAYTAILKRKKRVPIAEIFSITSLCSPDVRDLLLRLQIPDKSEEQVEQWIADAHHSSRACQRTETLPQSF
jgi:HD superfamily phosphohydrolase